MTATAEQYTTAAELLRRLASHPDRPVPNGNGELAELTEALAVAAQACEQVEEAELARGAAELECEEALLGVVSLWSLLERAAEVIDAHIAEHDGGTWETLTLAFELHQAVEADPDELGERLLGELHAARVALRAAGGLAAAVHRRDGKTIRQCLAGFEQASRAWQAAASPRQAVDEVSAGVHGALR